MATQPARIVGCRRCLASPFGIGLRLLKPGLRPVFTFGRASLTRALPHRRRFGCAAGAGRGRGQAGLRWRVKVRERGSRRPSRSKPMTQMEIQAPTRIARNGYKVDVSRGQRIGRVSSEWFNRPADERYLSLTDLHNSVKRRSERSKTRIVESEAIRVEASRDDPERLTLMLPGCRRAGRADALEFWPARQPGRRTCHLSAPASGPARRHQSAVRPDLAPRRAGEDARDRERPPRACER